MIRQRGIEVEDETVIGKGGKTFLAKIASRNRIKVDLDTFYDLFGEKRMKILLCSIIFNENLFHSSFESLMDAKALEKTSA